MEGARGHWMAFKSVMRVSTILDLAARIYPRGFFDID